MADAQYNTESNPRPAKFMVRMDGTGYAAGNTVQFTDSQLKVGGDTIMDANGFYTLSADADGTKSEIVRIANIDLPSINRLINPMVFPINDSKQEDLTIKHSQSGFALTRSNGENSIGQQLTTSSTVIAGSSLTMSATIVIDLSTISSEIPTDPFAVYSVPTLVFQVVDISAESTVAYEYTEKIRPIGGGTTATITIDNIATNLPKTAFYGVLVTFVGGGFAAPDASTAVAGFSMQLQGKISTSSTGQTILAKNGFASVWGENLCFVNKQNAMLRSGLFGFRVSSSGFQYSVNGGSTWKPINWT